MDADLLQGLRRAILLKIQKSISDSIVSFETYKKELNGLTKEDKEKLENIIKILEEEINRVNKYVEDLSKVNLPRPG